MCLEANFRMWDNASVSSWTRPSRGWPGAICKDNGTNAKVLDEWACQSVAIEAHYTSQSKPTDNDTN